MTELRLCERCSHLYSEHRLMKVNGFAVAAGRDLLRAECACCDCPEFIDEPDFLSPPLDEGVA